MSPMSASETKAPNPRSRRVLDAIYYSFAIFFFLWLFTYFWTTAGGPTLLAMTLVPVTYVLFVLNSLRENDLYPAPPPTTNSGIGAFQIGFALMVGYYMHTEYYDLGTSRAGDWDSTDLFMGALMTVLVMEYSRKRHMPLFVLNIVLMVYAVSASLVRVFFYRGGLGGGRVFPAMRGDPTPGVFGSLPQ